jgi:hypothetical protein
MLFINPIFYLHRPLQFYSVPPPFYSSPPTLIHYHPLSVSSILPSLSIIVAEMNDNNSFT